MINRTIPFSDFHYQLHLKEQQKEDLFLLIEKNNIEGLKTFLEKVEPKPDVNVMNAEGQTPLFIAYLKRQTEIFQLLLAAGADVNLRSNPGGGSALFYAVC